MGTCPTCGVFSLQGEEARKFEEYMNREPTQEELDQAKEADEYYREVTKDSKIEKLDEIINDLKDVEDWFYGKFSIIEKLEKFKEEEL